MDDEAEVGEYQQGGIGTQHRGTVVDDHGRQHAEDSDRGQLHDIIEYLAHHVVEAEGHLACHLALVADMHHGDAEEQGNHDDLHHGHRANRGDYVVGEHADKLVHHRQIRQLDNLGGCIGINLDERQEALQKAGDDESQRHREEGRHHEIGQGAEPQMSHLLDVVHREDARHDGEEHQWHHDKLQQVEEDDADGLDVAVDEVGMVGQQDACQHRQQQGDANLGSEG